MKEPMKTSVSKSSVLALIVIALGSITLCARESATAKGGAAWLQPSRQNIPTEEFQSSELSHPFSTAKGGASLHIEPRQVVRQQIANEPLQYEMSDESLYNEIPDEALNEELNEILNAPLD